MDVTTRKKTGGAALAIKASDLEMKQSWRVPASISSPDLLPPIPPIPRPTTILFKKKKIKNCEISINAVGQLFRYCCPLAKSPAKMTASIRPSGENVPVLSAGKSTAVLLRPFRPFRSIFWGLNFPSPNSSFLSGPLLLLRSRFQFPPHVDRRPHLDDLASSCVFPGRLSMG